MRRHHADRVTESFPNYKKAALFHQGGSALTSSLSILPKKSPSLGPIVSACLAEGGSKFLVGRELAKVIAFHTSYVGALAHART